MTVNVKQPIGLLRWLGCLLILAIIMPVFVGFLRYWLRPEFRQAIGAAAVAAGLGIGLFFARFAKWYSPRSAKHACK
jgi:hypothetical protein